MIKALLDAIDPNRGGFWNFRYSTISLCVIAGGALILYAGCDAIRHALWILDGVDLIIHEAGHPIFGLLGIEFIQFAGGTLMQLIMPTAFYIHFLRDSQPKSADCCLFWIGHNFLWIGRYIADARAQLLPLVGGGEHDWAYMLGVLGILPIDTTIGHAVDLAGCVLIALSAFSLYRHFQADRSNSRGS